MFLSCTQYLSVVSVGPDCPAASFSDTGSLTLPVSGVTSLYEPNVDCRYTLEVPSDMVSRAGLIGRRVERSKGKGSKGRWVSG